MRVPPFRYLGCALQCAVIPHRSCPSYTSLAFALFPFLLSQSTTKFPLKHGPNTMFTQTPRRIQMLERVPSLFSIRSRHNLHTSSMQQQQQQQQQRYRGSSQPRARLQGQRQDPQSPSHHRLRGPSWSRCPSLSPSLPSQAVLRALSALTP